MCKQVKWDRRFPTSDSNSHRPSQSHPVQSSRQETRKSRKWFLHFQTLRMLARPCPKKVFDVRFNLQDVILPKPVQMVISKIFLMTSCPTTWSNIIRIQEKSTCPDLREIQMQSPKKNLQETYSASNSCTEQTCAQELNTNREKRCQVQGSRWSIKASKDLEIFHLVSLNSWWLEELRSSRLLLVATSTPRGELIIF